MKNEKKEKKKEIVRVVWRLEFHEMRRGCNYSVRVDCDSTASIL